ncbi:MAG: hypothetical protein SCK57_09230 [Bacillota bacterium]|nr:hypothetical protein [Bacillota bacterium]MDW7677830.1 hypothetical protein [Bacillota bacterium]
MRALFARKASDLDELREMTASALRQGQPGQPYAVLREVVLEPEAFSAFADDLLEDQPWITPENGGHTEHGVVRCIRVVNAATGERVLVNSEGYAYSRYTALETE